MDKWRMNPDSKACTQQISFVVQVKQRESQEPGQAASCHEFLRQMAFREYSRYLSFHFPFTHERSLLEHLRAAPWKFNHRHFKVLCPLCHPKFLPLYPIPSIWTLVPYLREVCLDFRRR